MYPKGSRNSIQIEAEKSSQTSIVYTTEKKLPNTSKQSSVKPNTELETKTIKTSSQSKC